MIITRTRGKFTDPRTYRSPTQTHFLLRPPVLPVLPGQIVPMARPRRKHGKSRAGGGESGHQEEHIGLHRGAFESCKGEKIYESQRAQRLFLRKSVLSGRVHVVSYPQVFASRTRTAVACPSTVLPSFLPREQGLAGWLQIRLMIAEAANILASDTRTTVRENERSRRPTDSSSRTSARSPRRLDFYPRKSRLGDKLFPSFLRLFACLRRAPRPRSRT